VDRGELAGLNIFVLNADIDVPNEQTRVGRRSLHDGRQSSLRLVGNDFLGVASDLSAPIKSDMEHEDLRHLGQNRKYALHERIKGRS
jgi:hypothetical protein